MRKSCLLVVTAVLIACVCAKRVENAHEGTVRNEFIRDDDKCGDSLFWAKDGQVLRITGTGDMYDYNMTYPAPWFDERSKITIVDFPDGMTSIGAYAFRFFGRVEKFSIPSSVSSIGEHAFDSCSKLIQFVIPSSVSFIGDFAFDGCKVLKFFEVEQGNANYVSIDGVLIDVQSHALVRYPQGKTETSYTTPDGIKTIKSNAFSYSSNSLASVVISSGVETIEDSAFNMCLNLSSIVLPSSLRSIGTQAFFGCALKMITIPAGVTSISTTAFHQCSALASIDVDSGNSKYTSVDGVLIDRVSNTLVRYPPGKDATSYSIPSSVETIATCGFCNCAQLSEIIIPDSVSSIQSNAFAYCSALLSITIPESVTSIEGSAFSYCTSLKSVFYQGSTPLSSNLFSMSKALDVVCVSPDYEPDQFGGKPVNSTLDTCNSFQRMFSRCYKGSYKDSSITAEKRKNATEWESQTNGCIDYECENESGPMWWSMCNSSNKKRQLCLREKCVESESIETQWRVEMEMVDGSVQAIDANVTELMESIVELTGVKKEALTIGFEIGENGYVLKIVCLVDSEKTARIIAQSVNDLEKGEGCKYGVICRTKRATVFGNQMISGGNQIVLKTLCLMLVLSIASLI